MSTSHRSSFQMRPDVQNISNPASGGMSFLPNDWDTRFSMPIAGSSVQEDYAIPNLSNHSDGPFVPTGIFPPQTTLVTDQNEYAPGPHNIDQNKCSKTNARQSFDVAPSHVDSGYGGSCVSGRASNPSVKAGGGDDASSLTCTQCEGYTAKNNSELRKHINRHNKPYKCDMGDCIKGFATQNDLDRHRRTVHRKIFLDTTNAIHYRCFECRKFPAKSNRRNKMEWLRKDNFLAHLSRIHGIILKPSDNLDRYTVRPHYHPTERNCDISDPNDQAQHVALRGVGTGSMVHADLHGPHSRIAFASELAPSDQANDVFQEQRFELFFKRYPQLRPDILASSTDQQFISPNMLSSHKGNCQRTNDGPLQIRHDTTLQQPELYPSHSMPSALAHHDFDAGSFGSIPAQAGIRSHDVASDDEGTEECVSETTRGAKLLGNTPPQEYRLFQPTITSLSTNNKQTTVRIPFPGVLKQLSSQFKEHEVIFQLLKQVPRETLQAELDRRSPISFGDGAANEAGTTLKLLHSCPTCRKAFKWQCELKKHEKRHSKPYSCTWQGCTKKFGSKNDWKRHESKQHFNTELWICNVDSCGREWNRRENFKRHLKGDHSISGTAIDNKVDQCRRGKILNPYFWCGFCAKHIRVNSDEQVDAWIKRSDHIDDHFCGRGGIPQRHIEDWHHETLTVGTAQIPIHKRPYSDCMSSNHQNGPNPSRGSQKRPADATAADGPPAKKKTSAVFMWQCCKCADNMFMNVRTSYACIICEHPRCCDCQVTRDYLPDEESFYMDPSGTQNSDSVDVAMCA